MPSGCAPIPTSFISITISSAGSGEGLEGPPTQRPLRLEAAILSLIRSEVTSRSNCAKDNSTLRVSRPIEVVVLNCWVTETKETPWASKSSTSLAKSASDLVRRSTL